MPPGLWTNHPLRLLRREARYGRGSFLRLFPACLLLNNQVSISFYTVYWYPVFETKKVAALGGLYLRRG